MNACRTGSRRRIRASSASTTSTGESVRASNACDSSATVAHTGSLVAMCLSSVAAGSSRGVRAMIAALPHPFKSSVEPGSRLAYRAGVAHTAEVVIVGAGVMGVSTAYHLARLGVELTTHSIVTYERFKDEFGVDPNFRQHGYLILIGSEDELATARRSVALQRSLGVHVELLDAAATRALCPYLNTADLLGATYTPRDGYADPYLCATAIAARARDLSVIIKQQHEVRGFLRDGDRILGVTTAADSFQARATVIATGAWSGVVGRLAGVDIPVSPHRRHKFMTAPFPASRIPMATPFIIDPHTNFSLRREGPGLLLGHGRRDEPDGFSTEIDRSLEPALIERAIHRAPALADAELMRAWAGLYEMTPDQTGIVSAVPGVTGL